MHLLLHGHLLSHSTRYLSVVVVVVVAAAAAGMDSCSPTDNMCDQQLK